MSAQFRFDEIKLRVHLIRLDETPGLNVFLALEDGSNELLLRLKKLAYRSLDNPCSIPSERFGEFIDFLLEVDGHSGGQGNGLYLWLSHSSLLS
jgi:hypothetical protein